MGTTKCSVKLTTNFESNLDEIEAFLQEASAPQAFDRLLDELTDTVISNLESYPTMGRLFLGRPARSVEAINGLKRLSEQLDSIGQHGELREYVMEHFLLLYAHLGGTVYLLSIRHHRQLSFDFSGHWPA
jgi:plasmid stabilization system protein ParE